MTTAVDKSNALTADNLTARLAAGDDATFTTSQEAAETYIGGLLWAGLPLLPLTPGDKAPYGRFTPHGVYNATTDTDYWTGVLDTVYSAPAAGARLGVGLRLGGRLAALDSDVPEENVQGREWLAEMGYDPDTPPTVQTPGTVDKDGNPVHHGGGHWYILLPEDVDLTDVPGTVNVGGGDTPAALMTAGYLVLPPTHRNGGRYTLTGRVLDATPKLLDFLRDRAAEEAEKRDAVNRKRDTRSTRSPEEQAVLDDWRDATSWADILEPHGYVLDDRPDRCGCDKWARPGGSHTYSLVAHDCGEWGTYAHNYSDDDDHMEPEESLSKEALAAKLAGMEFKDFMRDVVGIQPAAPTVGLVPLDAETLAQARATAPDDSTVDGVEVDPAKWPEGHPNEPGLVAKIMNYSDQTRALYWEALDQRRKRVSPVTLLLAQLQLAGLAATETTTVSNSPVSMFLCAVGPSGTGKTASTTHAPTSVQRSHGGGWQENMDASVPIPGPTGIGSGEALADMVTDKVKDADTGKVSVVMRQPATAHVVEGELSGMLAKASGGTATIRADLMKAWFGETLGGHTVSRGASATTGPYQIQMTGTIQPKLAEGLVGRDSAASGMVQRLIFSEVRNPWRKMIKAGEMDPDIARPQRVPVLPPVPVGVDVALPDAVDDLADELGDLAEAERLDPMDTHSVLSRCRVAALCALWHGHGEVDDTIWEWSGAVMEHHRRSRAAVIVAAEQAAQERANDAATQRERSNRAGRYTVEQDVEKIAATLTRHIPAVGSVTRSDLRKTLKSTLRDAFFDPAIRSLVTSGVVAEEVAGGTTRYTLVQQVC